MSASQTTDTTSPAADQPAPAPSTGGAGSPSGLQRALVAIAALLTLLTPFLFGSSDVESVGNELVGDGLMLVTQHPVTRLAPNDPSVLPQALTTDWWGDLRPGTKLYRPIPTFLLGLTSTVASTGQVDPMTGLKYAYNIDDPGSSGLPFKFLMVAGKIICALLVLELAYALTKSRPTAFLAGLLFAVLPVHGHTVYDVGGLATLTATAFGLAAWIAWLRAGDRPLSNLPALAGCAVATLCAALSMEIAFLFPLVFFAADIGRKGAGSLMDGVRFAASKAGGLAVVAGALAVAIGLNLAMTGQLMPRYLPGAEVENPLIEAGALTRIVDGLRLAIGGLPVMFGINPFASTAIGFSADYSAPQIAVGGSPFAVANLIGLAAWAGALGLVVVLFKRCRSRAALLLAMLVALLAQAHLVAPAGDLFSERLLFFPSAILAVILAATLAPLLGRLGQVPGQAVAGVLALVLVWFSVSRADTYSDERNLWRITSRTTAEDSSRAHFNYGRTLLRDDSPSSAKVALRRAIESTNEGASNDHTLARALLARALMMDGEDAEAVEPLEEALAIQLEREGETWERSEWDGFARDDRTDVLLWQLTSLKVDRGIDPEGHLAYLDGLLDAGYESPYVHLYRGDTLRRLERVDEAEAAYRAGLEIEPVFSIVRRLGRTLRLQGRNGEAEVLYQEHLARIDGGQGATDNQRMEFLFQSADLAFEKGDFARAEQLLDEMEELGPTGSQRFRALVMRSELLTEKPIAATDRFERMVVAIERKDQAAKTLREAVTTWATNDELTRYAWQKYSSLLYDLSRYTAAANVLRPVVMETDSPTMRARLGECMFWRAEAQNAWATPLGAQCEQHLRRAADDLYEQLRGAEEAEVRPTGTDYLYATGLYADTRLLHLRALKALGDAEGFESVLRTEQDRSAESFGPLLVRLYHEIETGIYEEARTTLADLTARYPEAQGLADNVREALAVLEERLIEIGSEPTAEALRHCADIQFRLKNYEGAANAIAESIVLAQGDPIQLSLSRLKASEIQLKLRGPSEALTLVEDAINALGDANAQIEIQLLQQRRLLQTMLGREIES